MQKDLTQVKIFQTVLDGYFFETPRSYYGRRLGNRIQSFEWYQFQ